jgi:diketogulonate reductase-like aldo/keto reductase
MDNKLTKLSNGTEIPLLGLGTWQLTGETCSEAVTHALNHGYRHIDTADIYDNHEQVARGIADSEVEREDIFLTTKLWRTDFEPEKVAPAIERFKEELETDYFDLVLIHWPSDEVDIVETLAELHKFVEKGVIKNLGVSNYTISLLDELLKDLEEKYPEIELVNHQFELHPSLYQEDLVEFSEKKGLKVTAYSPVGRTEDLELDLIQELAEKYDRSPAEVILAWMLAKDLITIPKAGSKEHIEDNFAAQSLDIATEDIERIDNLDMHNRLVNPGFAKFDD